MAARPASARRGKSSSILPTSSSCSVSKHSAFAAAAAKCATKTEALALAIVFWLLYLVTGLAETLVRRFGRLAATYIVLASAFAGYAATDFSTTFGTSSPFDPIFSSDSHPLRVIKNEDLIPPGKPALSLVSKTSTTVRSPVLFPPGRSDTRRAYDAGIFARRRC